MDVTEQVNMEPPPQCQLSQSGFSHYLVLSPRKSAEGQEKILLSDAQGMEKAGLRGSRMAEGRGEQPTGSSAPAGSGPLLGAATWDPARVDSALSWPKVQGGGALGGWEWSCRLGLEPTSLPGSPLPQPSQTGDLSPGWCEVPPQTSCVPGGKPHHPEEAGVWRGGEENQRLKASQGSGGTGMVRREKPLSLGEGGAGGWTLQRRSANSAAREEFTPKSSRWRMSRKGRSRSEFWTG